MVQWRHLVKDFIILLKFTYNSACVLGMSLIMVAIIYAVITHACFFILFCDRNKMDKSFDALDWSSKGSTILMDVWSLGLSCIHWKAVKAFNTKRHNSWLAGHIGSMIRLEATLLSGVYRLVSLLYSLSGLWQSNQPVVGPPLFSSRCFFYSYTYFNFVTTSLAPF